MELSRSTHHCLCRNMVERKNTYWGKRLPWKDCLGVSAASLWPPSWEPPSSSCASPWVPCMPNAGATSSWEVDNQAPWTTQSLRLDSLQMSTQHQYINVQYISDHVTDGSYVTVWDWYSLVYAVSFGWFQSYIPKHLFLNFFLDCSPKVHWCQGCPSCSCCLWSTCFSDPSCCLRYTRSETLVSFCEFKHWRCKMQSSRH